MRAPGIVQFVDVGVEVWSTKQFRAAAGEPQPIGGLVVGVTEKINAETGEADRAFLVFDHQQTRPYIRWATIPESEVDRDAIHAPDVNVLVGAWRRLAEDVAFSAPHKQRRGAATPAEVRACKAMQELMAVVFGRDLDVLEPALTQGQPAAPRPTYPVHSSLIDD